MANPTTTALPSLYLPAQIRLNDMTALFEHDQEKDRVLVHGDAFTTAKKANGANTGHCRYYYVHSTVATSSSSSTRSVMGGRSAVVWEWSVMSFIHGFDADS